MKQMKVGLAGSKIWNNPRPIQNALSGIVTSKLVVLSGPEGAGKFLRQYTLRHAKLSKTKCTYLELDKDIDGVDAYAKVFKELATTCDLILIFKSQHSKVETMLVDQCKREEKPYILFEI